ncbi:MAG: SDR family oxidoreductase, partial [Actinomycetota bacterium]|nr:SDR family oxidoreductase [Actinomycetota bacterium]
MALRDSVAALIVSAVTSGGKMRLDGKVAVITGGASGIGAGTVRRFVEEGARVLISDLDEERGNALVAELGDATAFLRTDVSEEEQVAAMIAEATDRWGQLDCLFNNAGFGGALGPIENTTVDDYDLTMDVLLKSVFLGMKHAAPVMKAQGSGSIISTASVAGLRPGYAPHLYSVAKCAVIHMTKSVALELGEDNIRVNCICP